MHTENTKRLVVPNSNVAPCKCDSDFSFSSVVEYNFTVSHMEHSNAHATNLEVVWMLPVYTKFLKVNKNSHKLNLTELRDNIMFTVIYNLLHVCIIKFYGYNRPTVFCN